MIDYHRRSSSGLRWLRDARAPAASRFPLFLLLPIVGDAILRTPD
jgi:hypothetical protein